MPNSNQSGMMPNQTNIGSMPNLSGSVDQSIDLLADIMGGTSSANKMPPMNTNMNNANDSVFGNIMSERFSSAQSTSMPGGLNTLTNLDSMPPGGGSSGYPPCPPSGAPGGGAMQRQMSHPGAVSLMESGRPNSLPNVADPPRKYFHPMRDLLLSFISALSKMYARIGYWYLIHSLRAQIMCINIYYF